MKVVVVGAGYAGTIAANRLSKKVKQAQITVVNPSADFVERVRLHEEIAGTGGALTPLEDMFGERVGTQVDSVVRIGDGQVMLKKGTTLDFDYLFVAVGSSVEPMHGTVPVGSWAGAHWARQRLTKLGDGAVVTVIGGGLTGIETAAEVAYARPELDVRLVGASIGHSLSESGRNRVRTGLDRLGVTLVEDSVNEVHAGAGSSNGTVGLASGAEFRSDLVLWAIVSGIPGLIANSGLAVNEEGRAVVDEYLRSVDDERIFVVGDCAAVPGARLCCAAATPQGAHAADTLTRLHKGRKPKPYSMGYVGQAVSIGRKDGLIQSCRRDDSVRRFYISGRAAAFSKEFISRYAKYGSRTATYGWVPGTR